MEEEEGASLWCRVAQVARLVCGSGARDGNMQ